MRDTLAVARRLADAGFRQHQAEALASALREMFPHQAITKASLNAAKSNVTYALERANFLLISSQLIVAFTLFAALTLTS